MIGWYWLFPTLLAGVALGLVLARPQANALRIRLVGRQEAYNELAGHTVALQRELSRHKMLVASFTEAARAETARALEKAGRRT